MNETIKLAIEKGGYKDGYKDDRIAVYKGQLFTFGPKFHKNELENMLVLDPLFWQALGKALGWRESKFYQSDIAHPHIGESMPEAKWYFRNYMNLIWEGGDTETFWKELIK